MNPVWVHPGWLRSHFEREVVLGPFHSSSCIRATPTTGREKASRADHDRLERGCLDSRGWRSRRISVGRQRKLVEVCSGLRSGANPSRVDSMSWHALASNHVLGASLPLWVILVFRMNFFDIEKSITILRFNYHWRWVNSMPAGHVYS